MITHPAHVKAYWIWCALRFRMAIDHSGRHRVRLNSSNWQDSTTPFVQQYSCQHENLEWLAILWSIQ